MPERGVREERERASERERERESERDTDKRARARERCGHRLESIGAGIDSDFCFHWQQGQHDDAATPRRRLQGRPPSLRRTPSVVACIDRRGVLEIRKL